MDGQNSISIHRIVILLWVIILPISLVSLTSGNLHILYVKSRELRARINSKNLRFAVMKSIMSADYELGISVKLPPKALSRIIPEKEKNELHRLIINEYAGKINRIRDENLELYEKYKGQISSYKDIGKYLKEKSPKLYKLYQLSEFDKEFKRKIMEEIKKSDPDFFDKISGI